VEIDERRWWTLGAVCVATFMLLIDITIVNVALPAIAKDLGSSFTDLQWVVDAYALSLASLLLTAGSLADLFGRRRVFVVGLGLFTLSSLLCGLATTPLFLTLARAAQGIGGAAMFATSLALLAQSFHGKERGTAFGIWGATSPSGRWSAASSPSTSAGSRSSSSTCRSASRPSSSPCCACVRRAIPSTRGSTGPACSASRSGSSCSSSRWSAATPRAGAVR
jgi:MFS family permease